MLTVLAFVVALGLLVAVHEYGHYRVAVACGVKVLRFSIGFGKPLLRWRRPGSPTEFVLAAIPLGGYVRMLDEREAPVAPEELHLAFNRKPLRARAAVVAAGPLANLLLAVLLYSLVHWIGVDEPRAIVSTPVAGSLAAQAGVMGGERVEAVAIGDAVAVPVRSFEDLRWQLTQAALNGEDARLDMVLADGGKTVTRQLALSSLRMQDADADMGQKIGIVAPWSAPVLGGLVEGAAAERAGLREGDRVLRVDATAVGDGAHLRRLIRASVDAAGQAQTQQWRVLRQGQELDVAVTPEVVHTQDAPIGKIGAYVGAPPEMVTVQSGPLEALGLGLEKTWDVSVLSLKMLGRMLIGEASLKNLSGPLTIADYAGKSASMGFTQYLVFLALISVSLGVLNLLPLPVLDGGHLMYYLWEGVTGRPISEAWMNRLQRAGIGVLLLMMSIAFFNDLSRILG